MVLMMRANKNVTLAYVILLFFVATFDGYGLEIFLVKV